MHLPRRSHPRMGPKGGRRFKKKEQDLNLSGASKASKTSGSEKGGARNKKANKNGGNKGGPRKGEKGNKGNKDKGDKPFTRQEAQRQNQDGTNGQGSNPNVKPSPGKPYPKASTPKKTADERAVTSYQNAATACREVLAKFKRANNPSSDYLNNLTRALHGALANVNRKWEVCQTFGGDDLR